MTTQKEPRIERGGKIVAAEGRWEARIGNTPPRTDDLHSPTWWWKVFMSGDDRWIAMGWCETERGARDAGKKALGYQVRLAACRGRAA